MAFSSLTNLTPLYYTNHTPRFPHFTAPNCLIRNHILKLPPLFFHQPKIHKPTPIIPPRSTLLSIPKINVSKYFVQKIATLLLGSLVFAGILKPRPVFAAVPTQETESLLSEKSDDSEEEVMCMKLVHENPRDINALKMAVNVKMKRGKTDEAVKYVENLIELQPTEMEWRLLQALCYDMMGNLSKAKSLFNDILKQKPLLLRALHGLAMVMHKNREGRAVFEMLDKALMVARKGRKVNEERNIRILAAQMHVVKGNYEEAMEEFQDLIDENPRDFRPYLCQGIIFSLLDKRDEAEKRFDMYRALVPEEFSQRGFIDDVVLAAKKESKKEIEKGIKN